MSEYKLTAEILNLSQSNNWDMARLEWELHDIYEADEPKTCLCGHFPIREICHLQNKLNRNLVIVGNSCVKKFIGLPSDLIFQAVKRVKKDKKKSLNKKAIQHAYEKGWITMWERNFSINTMRKKDLSVKQIQTRININEKMLTNMKRNC